MWGRFLFYLLRHDYVKYAISDWIAHMLCSHVVVWAFLFFFQVLARKAKNQCTWKGFSAIHVALQELKVFLV